MSTDSLPVPMSRMASARMLSLLIALGMGVVAYMLLQSMSMSAARRGSVEKTVDVSTIKPGEIRVVDGLDVPVWVLRRTPAMLAALDSPSVQLDDPWSMRSVQPNGVDRRVRSIRPEFFVFVPIFELVNANNGVWSALAVEHVASSKEPIDISGAQGKWLGGFRDAAGKGLYFDYAGRVFNYSSARWLGTVTNIAVPQHEFIASGELRINVGDLSAVWMSKSTTLR